MNIKQDITYIVRPSSLIKPDLKTGLSFIPVLDLPDRVQCQSIINEIDIIIAEIKE